MARPTVGQRAWGPVLNQDITGVEAKAQDALDAAAGAAASASAAEAELSGRLSEAGLSATIAAAAPPRASKHTYLSDYQGAGVSDTTALTNAIAASAGKTLHLEGKALTLSDVIESTANGVTIDARGATLNLVDDGTGTGRIFRARDCEDFTWLGGLITQTAAARTGVYGLLTVINIDNALIDGLRTIGGSSCGVWGQQVTNSRLVNISVEDSKADGIHFSRATTDLQIVAPRVRNSGDDAVAIVSVMADGATTYAQCARVTVSDPLIRDLTFGGGVAFIGCKDSSLIGGVIENVDDAGFKTTEDTVAGTHVPSDCNVIGTRVRGAADCFRVGMATDITLDGVVGLGATNLGLLIAGATRMVMNGGKLRGGTDVGVFQASGTGNHLIGVDLRGNTGGPSAGGMTLTNCITA